MIDRQRVMAGGVWYRAEMRVWIVSKCTSPSDEGY